MKYIIKDTSNGLYFHMIANEDMLFGPYKDAMKLSKEEADEFIILAEQKELKAVPEKSDCEDCGDEFEDEFIRGWKYEPDVRVCENCFEERLKEE